jgi:predicted metalloprotease with PDZ domain
MLLDAKITEKSKGRYTLRDPVIELLRLARAGKPFHFGVWSSIVKHYAGDYGVHLHSAMSKGSWVVPPPAGDFFGANISLRETRQEVFDLGFAMEPVDGRIVARDVDTTSRAFEAGIRGNDTVTFTRYKITSGLDDPLASTMLTLERNGREFEVEYFARSRETATAWELVKI